MTLGENTTFLLNHIFSHTFHILFDTTYGILLYKQGFEDLAGMKSVNDIHTIFYPLIEKPDTPLVWLFILSKTMYYF